MLAGISSGMNRPFKLLDFGCGTGDFLKKHAVGFVDLRKDKAATRFSGVL